MMTLTSSLSVDTTAGSFIVDSAGRRRIFRGVNVVSKKAPYLPTMGAWDMEHSLNELDIEYLKTWGFNMVRLGVMWPAVVPSPGFVNETYLEEVKTLITSLHEHGISTLVDLHQDVWSGFLCGEGMPDWVYETAMDLVNKSSLSSLAFPAPLPFDMEIGEDGKPSAEACANHSFFTYYLTFQSEALWATLYGSEIMWEHMGDHWGNVSKYLQGTAGLMGYELINEPWPSKGYEGSPHVLSDKDTLLPMYQYLHGRIRAWDDETLVFFEPLVMESYEALLSVNFSLTNFPEYGIGGESYANRSVFAYHIYCSNDADGTPKPMVLCRDIVKKEWEAATLNVANMKVGGFLTEFGAVSDDEDSITLLELQTSQADDHFQGWSYWTYKSFDDITTQNPATETFFFQNGSLQDAKIQALSRTYAQEIAGQPLTMSFDPSTSGFSLEYSLLAEIDYTTTFTTIFVPCDLQYPKGYRVKVSPSAGVSWEETPLNSTDLPSAVLILVSHEKSLLSSDSVIKIEISEKWI